MTIAEIAYQLGFEHPQSFSKFFKQKTKHHLYNSGNHLINLQHYYAMLRNSKGLFAAHFT